MPICCQKCPQQSSLPLFSLIPCTALVVTIFACNILQSDHLLLCQCDNNLFLFLIPNSILIPNYFLLCPSRSIWTAAAGLWTWVTHPAFQSSIPILSLYGDVASTNSLSPSCLNFLLSVFLSQARFNLPLIELKGVSLLVFLKTLFRLFLPSLSVCVL